MPPDQPTGILPQTDPLGGYETPPQQPGSGQKSKLKFVIIGAAAFVVLLLVVALFAASGTKKEPSTPAANSSTKTNPNAYKGNGGYAFVPPIGWSKDESAMVGTTASYTKSNGKGSLPSTISITTEETKATNLSDYLASSAELAKKQFTDYTEDSREKVSLGNQDAYLITSHFTSAGYQLSLQQLVTLKSGVGYNLAAFGPTTNFATDADAIKESLLSFSP